MEGDQGFSKLGQMGGIDVVQMNLKANRGCVSARSHGNMLTQIDSV